MGTEEMLREVGLPHAFWGFPKLPLAIWAIVFRVAWFCGYSANSESLSMARIRARSAAERLIDLARDHQSVFVMGHGTHDCVGSEATDSQGLGGSEAARAFILAVQYLSVR
jgi:hypothetical protein